MPILDLPTADRRIEAYATADQAGLLRDPDMAATRMRALLAIQGVG